MITKKKYRLNYRNEKKWKSDTLSVVNLANEITINHRRAFTNWKNLKYLHSPFAALIKLHISQILLIFWLVIFLINIVVVSSGKRRD